MKCPCCVSEEQHRSRFVIGPEPKRYILFTYNDYYPTGGLGDVTGTFDTWEDAAEAAKTMGGCDNVEIMDRYTWQPDIA